MADTSISPNTDVGQKYNEGNLGRCEIGERVRASVYQDRTNPRCVLTETDTKQVIKYTFGAANNGDAVSFKIDGGSIPFTATAATNTTAAAGKTAIDAAKLDGVYASVIESAIAAGSDLTITFKSYGVHSDAFVPTVGTTATRTVMTAGSKRVRGKPGRFIAYAPTQGDPSIVKCRMPASASDRIVGIIARGPYPNHQTPPNQYGLAEDEGWPEKMPIEVWERGEIHARTKSDVNAGDPVYVIFNPEADRGLAVNSDLSAAGVSQVSDLTVTPSATDKVGFHFTVNGVVLPSLTATSVDLATDNAALRDALNNSAAYSAHMASPAIVTGGKVRITWIVGHAPSAFSDDSSGGTADVAHAVQTAETAATAATALRKEGATFTETRTLAQGSAYIDLG